MQSRFADGKVEGVYVRVDGPGGLVSRAKVVRPDFIQGITKHWMTQVMTRNKLKF